MTERLQTVDSAKDLSSLAFFMPVGKSGMGNMDGPACTVLQYMLNPYRPRKVPKIDTKSILICHMMVLYNNIIENYLQTPRTVWT